MDVYGWYVNFFCRGALVGVVLWIALSLQWIGQQLGWT